ncbi:MAG TPA: tRNA (N(6)-L-threonylcarbamoyladenosine(37)-C(2))-methylthiotransferase MtaB [Rhizomicrobium sp.]|nr:tRNA (N(6)-L-threonylcarbamoyladenosine(37)-C(2))-methylthiotransferase MtaB [Rhizomicrobium sp.]
MTLQVVTFGCRLNAYESQAIRDRAAEAQLRDALVVNTCAVTHEAVRQSRQAIRKFKRENPACRIIVTGCAAQIEPQAYAAMPEVDAVFGNAEKLRAGSYADFGIGQSEKIRVNDIMSLRETTPQMVDHFDGKTRAFLQVQNGCDHRCTFCVIPYGRGNSRSVAMGAVVTEARRLLEKGFAEIVLTGVDLTSYGGDLPGTPSLGTLVEKLLKQLPELKRLRLSSLDAIEADPILMRTIAEEERLMPHFHLSAQSGDDMILKRMKRRHSRADMIAFCDTVRRYRPDAAFGADLIAGFPTESEAMFENSLSLVDEAGLSRLHVFPFSPRPGTAACKMPQLPRAVIKDRAIRLRRKGEAALTARLDGMKGSRHTVLMERGGIGRTPCFTPVTFAHGMPGTFLPLTITGRDGDHLTGLAA